MEASLEELHSKMRQGAKSLFKNTKESIPLLADIEAGTTLGNIASRIAGTPAPTPPPPQSTLQQIRSCACLPTLSYWQRLLGAFFCFLAGLIMIISSFTSLTSLLLGNPVPFAVKYTAGNILAMGASTFVVGPARQCQTMFSAERRLISAAYVASLSLTLICVFRLHSQLFTMFSLSIQLIAMSCYTLSYIPFGQSIMRRSLRRLSPFGG